MQALPHQLRSLRLPRWQVALLGLTMAWPVSFATIAAAGAPALVVEGPRWPPPMRVGMAREIRVSARPTARRSWCNYAAHSERLKPLPMASDPVFRRPSAAARAQLKTLITSVAALPAGAPAPTAAGPEMGRLMGGKDGPTLARIALQDRDERVRTLAARATASIIGRHPRLAAFAMEDMKKVGAPLAVAAVRALLAARCDTPAVHATDGLEHRDPGVRRATIMGVLKSAAGWTDIGLMAQVLQRAKAEPEPLLRALIARGVAALGWLPAEPTMAHLLGDKNAWVRGEALVALAALRRSMDPGLLQAYMKSPDRQLKAAAIRAIPLAMLADPARARGWLKPLLLDKGRVVDPLGVDGPTTVGALARLALQRLGAGAGR